MPSSEGAGLATTGPVRVDAAPGEDGRTGDRARTDAFANDVDGIWPIAADDADRERSAGSPAWCVLEDGGAAPPDIALAATGRAPGGGIL